MTKKVVSILLSAALMLTAAPAVMAAPVEQTGVTGKAYFADFVWGEWWFDFHTDEIRTLENGELDGVLSSEENYTHGDVVIVDFDNPVTFDNIRLTSENNGEMPYKMKVQYSDQGIQADGGTYNIPSGLVNVQGDGYFYDLQSPDSKEINITLDSPVTVKSLVFQAETNGADAEPGTTPWTVSGISLSMTEMEVPQAPVDLTAGERESTSLQFSWTPADKFASEYEVFRSTSEAGEYVSLGKTSSTSFTDTTCKSGTTYFYKIKAGNVLGMSDFSEVISLSTLSGAPAADEIGEVNIAADGDNITLSWDAVNNASGYNIYRSTGKYSDFTYYAETEETTFADKVPGEKYKYYYKVAAKNADGIETELSDDVSMDEELFGDTMTIFSPSDSSETIYNITNTTCESMKDRLQVEFSSNRYGFLFKPGDYMTDYFQTNVNNKIFVGYYTSLYGLGISPTDTILPVIEVSSWGENSLTNFWRSAENFTVEGGSPDREVKWAASQAAPLRRLNVNGKLHFDDIGKSASGGFLADTYTSGQAGSWSQQQYFIRNSELTGGWYDGVWNMVFVGTENAPVESVDWASKTYQSYTTIDETPLIREKPFLYLDETDGNYKVFVPALRENSVGVSWSEDDPGAGKSISIDDFYVAKADVDTADTINAALAQGKHLLLTPGIYEVDKPIKVTNENTVVLGLAYATIVPTNGNDAMQIADVGGVTVAGILFDAGENGSEHLLQVGEEGSSADHSDNPTLLADVVTRVGGAVDGKAEVTVEINSNDVINDHLWLWRADHGTVEGATGWDKNVGKNGLVVNGDDVICYGLFVEHFQEYQTLWNGENGRTYFYQSEIPYDPPYQSDYMSHDGTVKGYASYKVADDVTQHYAAGLGIYDVFINTEEWVELENAMEVPDGTRVHHACIVSLGAGGGTNHVINGIGEGVKNGEATKSGVDDYYVARVPRATESVYDFESGLLTLTGRNFTSDNFDVTKIMIVSDDEREMTLDSSLVEEVTADTTSIQIKFSADGAELMKKTYGYENGAASGTVVIEAGFMPEGEAAELSLTLQNLQIDPVIKDGLQALYDQGLKLEQGTNSSAIWFDFLYAMTDARGVLEDEKATIWDVEDSTARLEGAISALDKNVEDPQPEDPNPEDPKPQDPSGSDQNAQGTDTGNGQKGSSTGESPETGDMDQAGMITLLLAAALISGCVIVRRKRVIK